MRIALIGTRGVPARYGGFETCVEEVGQRLVALGHEVVVFCRPHAGADGGTPHAYRGMQLVHLPVVRKRSLETLCHTALSVVHRSLRGVDAAIVFNSANSPLLPVLRARRIPVATHVDGLEWKRTKWGPAGRRYYRTAESLAVRWSDGLISDAKGIADYYCDEFRAPSMLIAYGAPVFKSDNSSRIQGLDLSPGKYHLVVARFEPENHVLEIVRGYQQSRSRLPLVVVGSAPYADDYTASIREAADDRVRILGGVWDQDQLNQLYCHALTYLHGHSVGGTNPSLLRAAGAGTFTIAYDVSFNREVLGELAAYFAGEEDVARELERAESEPAAVLDKGADLQRAITRYNWDDVAASYEDLCLRLASGRYPRRRPSGRRFGKTAMNAAVPKPSVAPKLHADPGTPKTVLIVNPSPDVYGADLQMLESAAAMLARGWRVVVALPSDGELVPRIRALGAEVRFMRFPVLRKSFASPTGLATMVGSALVAFGPARRLIAEVTPAVLYVNTVTLPWWIAYGRLTRVPVICHLHEAERDGSRALRTALMLPLRLAEAVIVISTAAFDAMIDVAPHLRSRAELVYNGVPDSPTPVDAAVRNGPTRVLTIGRLSPRKAPDVTLEAVAQLRRAGRDVVVEFAGTTFEGYEWFEHQLRARAQHDDLRDAVTFSGYCSPIWPALERADIVVAPSPQEPFGNAVVEAQLALRPVVATGAQGHLESITDEMTGLLVGPGDAQAIAASVARLIDDDVLASSIVDLARRIAVEKFSTQRYGDQITALVQRVAGLRASRWQGDG